MYNAFRRRWPETRHLQRRRRRHSGGRSTVIRSDRTDTASTAVASRSLPSPAPPLPGFLPFQSSHIYFHPALHCFDSLCQSRSSGLFSFQSYHFRVPGPSGCPFLRLPMPLFSFSTSWSWSIPLKISIYFAFTRPSLPDSRPSASALHFIHFQVSLFLQSLCIQFFSWPFASLLSILFASRSLLFHLLCFQVRFPPKFLHFHRSCADRSAVIRSDFRAPVSTSVASRSFPFPVLPLPGPSRSPFLRPQVRPGPLLPIPISFVSRSVSYTRDSILPFSTASISRSLSAVSILSFFSRPSASLLSIPVASRSLRFQLLCFQIHFPPKFLHFHRGSANPSAVTRFGFMAPVSTSVASRSLLFPVFPLPGTSRSPFLLLPGPSRPSASDIHLLFYHVSLSFTGPSFTGSKHSASTLYFIHFQVSLFLLSLYFQVFKDPLLLRCPSPLLPGLLFFCPFASRSLRFLLPWLPTPFPSRVPPLPSQLQRPISSNQIRLHGSALAGEPP